jgi:competence protein ComEC
LYAARRAFVRAIGSHLPQRDAALLSGIAIGAKDGMDDATQDMFRRVGLTHIVVLSGYNITVVSDVVVRIGALVLPRVLSLPLGALTVVLFTVATGASATAVRAASMALLALSARLFNRRYDIIRALFLVAGGMVAWNPRVLVFDPSFQLSFLATFGLVTLSPLLEKKLHRIPNLFSLRQTVAATLATQAFVVPLLIRLNGQLSFISLLANVIVLPVVPLSMFLSYVLGVGGALFPALSLPLSFPAFFVSHGMLLLTEFFSALPFAARTVGVPPPALLVAIYAVLLTCVLRSLPEYVQKPRPAPSKMAAEREESRDE